VNARLVFPAIVVLLLAAAPASAHQPYDAVGGQPIFASATRADTVAARTNFFGERNVDQRTGEVRDDKVILSWFGVSNFAMAIGGHVVLLDAWVPRGAHSGWVPTTPEELAALDPELVLLGHGHFDHAADAVPIALASGARVVGTGEHCELVEGQGLPPRQCIAAIPTDAMPGHVERPRLLRGVRTTVLEHLHSATTGPDGYHAPVLPPPSGTAVGNPPTLEDMVELFGHLPDAEGGAILWKFRVGRFTLVWHDSSGPLSDRAPGILKALRRLGPVDVEVGSIQGFNQFFNGLRDPVDYIEAIRPRTFVPAHHDDWVVGISTRGIRYRDPFFDELGTLSPGTAPRVRFITDPEDYLNHVPLTWRPRAAISGR
jgi:L-ascorbate metabolism protein UlaG (beta-lactamase superfamily)